MFKRKGGEGVKGFLNNVKKKLHFSYMEASLMTMMIGAKIRADVDADDDDVEEEDNAEDDD